MFAVNRINNALMNWSRFELCNGTSITDAFESMCRMLFNEFFFSGSKILTSSPNNPGIEVEPVLHNEKNERISFQAKYFTTRIDYGSVESSMSTAIKYYTGRLDVIYLYCNKDFSHNSDSFIRIKDSLGVAGIKLVAITNEEIFNQIITNQYSSIAARFFLNETLTPDWFKQQSILVLRNLEPRYNSAFSVSVDIERQVGIFMLNQEAADYFNAKKSKALIAIIESNSPLHKYRNLIDETIARVKAIPSVYPETISHALDWYKTIVSGYEEELEAIDCDISDLTKKIYSEKDRSNRNGLYTERTRLEDFIDALNSIQVDDSERAFLHSKTLVLDGEAGSGKSHLLGTLLEKSIVAEQSAVLLLGQAFLSNAVIEQQVLENLGLSCSFDEFIDILDGIGMESQRQSVLIIDAINESENKDIWKTGLARLIQTVESRRNLRLIVSIRNGYENLVFSDSILKSIREREIPKITHFGFAENTIEATMQFFNQYNITFDSSDLLQYEFSNPLMLKLYCEVKNVRPNGLFDMFEKYCDYVDTESKKVCDIDYEGNLLKQLITEITSVFIETDTEHIDQTTLFSLRFWNMYDIESKSKYVSSILRCGFLSKMAISDSGNGTVKEVFYFAYQRFADYYSAQAMVYAHAEEAVLRSYIIDSVLSIKDRQITRWSRRGIFVIICGLFAEKYGRECFDILDGVVDPDMHLLEGYVDSFAWRKPESIDENALIDFVNKNCYKGVFDALLNMLINMSAVTCHPLNADFLHTRLEKMDISMRDYIWTIHINQMTTDNRAYYLAELFQKGKMVSEITHEEKRLLCILYSWMLSSSNRYLRDNVSECLIELLKNEFGLCAELLAMFSDVNDPYIIQRLYGVVFGVCMKSADVRLVDFLNMAELVFESIFDVEYIYPDILLRDYARLIIERFIHLYPDSNSKIVVSKIRPPFKSIAIPMVDEVDYYTKDANGGLNSIVHSMTPDVAGCGVGMYGDFGRYVWQSAIKDFEGIGDKQVAELFYYSMKFIVDELGYQDELFAEYDNRVGYGRVSRGDTKTTERIGKKYQWITMYNVLARLSDTHKVEDFDVIGDYCGAWSPYVRDFDPTLNTRKPISVFLPHVEAPSNCIKIEWLDTSFQSDIDRDDWVAQNTPFFINHGESLLVNQGDKEWVALYQYCCRKSDEGEKERDYYNRIAQEVWSMSFSYFTSESDFNAITKAMKNKSISRGGFPEGWNVYTLYNREYYWSPGYKDVFRDNWCSIDIDGNSIDVGYNDNEPIGKVMPTYIDFLWEEQCDASQDESTSFFTPCGFLAERLGLSQKEDDGLFYSSDELVAFDTKLAGESKSHCLIIKKKYLTKFLNENNLRLLWFCIGEKQSFVGSAGNQKWSSWSGIYTLGKGVVNGSMSTD